MGRTGTSSGSFRFPVLPAATARARIAARGFPYGAITSATVLGDSANLALDKMRLKPPHCLLSFFLSSLPTPPASSIVHPYNPQLLSSSFSSLIAHPHSQWVA
jgi:hypothetical protein